MRGPCAGLTRGELHRCNSGVGRPPRGACRRFTRRGSDPICWLYHHVLTGPRVEEETVHELQIVGLAEQAAPSWQERALCAQTDPEAFFPEKGGSTREAKRVCTGCDVRSECLDYALENDERFGIWGGLSERERRKLKRRAVFSA